MFKSILIKDSFLQRDLYIEFDKGLNVLVGRNGCGKSTVLEYLAYSLYGTNALRSPIKEFPQGFTVETKFSISSAEYKVIRTIKSSSLYELVNDKYIEIVKGTTPVNTKIKELLGYDYSVFTLINFIKQHDLLTLTESTPTQLLSLIELVSGLSGSYKLEEQLKQRRKELKVEEDALKISIDVALKDVDDIFQKDTDFEILIETHEDPLTFLRDTGKEYLNQIDDISNKVLTLTTKEKELEKINASLNEYPDYQSLSEKELQSLLDSVQETYDLLLQLEATYKSLSSYIKSFQKPDEEYTLEYLDSQELALNIYNRYKQEQKLKESLEKHKIECPNCKHEFYNTSNNVVFEFLEEPEIPVLTFAQITSSRNWLNNLEEYNTKVKELENIESKLSSLDKAEIQLKLESIRKVISLKSSYNDNLQDLINLDYYDNTQPIETQIKLLEQAKEDIYKQYQELEELKTKFSEYVLAKLEFEKKEEVRKNFGTLIEELNTKKRTYMVLLDTLKKVKANIQTTILPKLNFTSSQLLSQVTSGERNKVQITDDFKLSIDNQVVSTLEGSAQVLTNIALRCSLLTTFYSDSFLVSLQDESDAPLALERFEALIEAYKKLEEQNFQLIVVSHKDYNYGNIIDLEDTIYTV